MYNLCILDCRYPYEFAGGQIVDAINVSTITSLEQTLFSHTALDQGKAKDTLVVLHCEFSIQRAPRMYKLEFYV